MDPPISPSHAFSLPSSARQAAIGSAHSLETPRGRKRNSSLLEPSSPDDDFGADDQDQANGTSQSSKRAPGVKRACNECRQQKLRCDVQQDPFASCSRCQKQNLTCQIDESFRRIGKRSRHAELERRAAELEHENAILRRQVGTKPLPTTIPAVYTSNNGPASYNYPGIGTDEGPNYSQEAVESLLDLKQGLEGNPARRGSRKTPAFRTLGNVMLARERIAEIFEEYWQHYHRFLPLLDPQKPPEHYFALSELLFWTIVVVGARHFPGDRDLLRKLTAPYKTLMWATISNVPQNYHVVKALCLLCTWPLPASSTSMDPTVLLCGVMINTALQIGLHRPSHAEDFSRSHIHLKEYDIRDRLKTWAACNIVAQSISTGYGLPPQTVYDSTLEPAMTLRTGPDSDNVPMPEELRRRLELEKFANNVTKTLYSYNANSSSKEQALFATMTAQDLDKQFRPGPIKGTRKIETKENPADAVYLGAVRLHIRLYAFFEAPNSTTYRSDLVSLYAATIEFLDAALDLDNKGVKYGPNYIMQMMLAAAYTLSKLLNSFFVVHLEPERERGCILFSKTVAAVRAMSVQSNDLPQRLSEVVVQLWHYSGAGRALSTPTPNGLQGQESNASGQGITAAEKAGDPDDSLQLKLRTRMSMSLVYDSVWSWRDELQGKVRAEGLDAAVRNPTSPEATLDSPKFPRRASALGGSNNSTSSGTPHRPGTSSGGGGGGNTTAQSFIGATPRGNSAGAAGGPTAVSPSSNGHLALDQTISPAADPNDLATYAGAGGAAAAAMPGVFAGGAGGAAAAGLGYGYGAGTTTATTLYGDSYEFFDPMSWLLDGSEGMSLLTGMGFMGDGSDAGGAGTGAGSGMGMGTGF